MNQKYLIISILIVIVLIIIYKFSTMKLSMKLIDRDTGINFIGGRRGVIGTEHFVNLNPAPLNYRISTGSDRKLTNCPESTWRHSPSNLSLVNKNNFVAQGSQLPLHPTNTEQVSDGPTVDGTKNTPKNMFMFANNQCNPKCCPSTYSCDGGCICTTKQQRQFIASRGKNNNGESEY